MIEVLKSGWVTDLEALVFLKAVRWMFILPSFRIGWREIPKPKQCRKLHIGLLRDICTCLISYQHKLDHLRHLRLSSKQIGRTKKIIKL